MNESFLGQVASTYYEKVNETQELSFEKICFVFSNRRAGLFFKRELQRLIDKPIFSPRIISINDLFLRYSTLRQVDKVDLIFTLYNVYIRYIDDAPLFGDFITIGDTMIRDFDELDKYMVDVKVLFSNIDELKSINSNYLTEEQRILIYKFWGHVVPNNDDVPMYNEAFIGLWSKLYGIYSDFKAELQARGIGYDGMIFRDVVEDLKSNNGENDLECECDRYVFVGFNGLNKTEELLLKTFRSIGDYYFDYPQWIRNMKDTAGYFVEKNLECFKSIYELHTNNNFDSTEQKRKIYTYGVPSNVGQVELLPQIISNFQANRDIDNTNTTRYAGIETAIVLPDEKMLLPTIHALPEFDEGVNITMGYPLQQSVVASFVANVISLYKNRRGDEFYYKHILKVLNHPIVRAADEDSNDMASFKLMQRLNNEKLIYANVIELTAGLKENSNVLLAKLFQNEIADFALFMIELLEVVYNVYSKKFVAINESLDGELPFEEVDNEPYEGMLIREYINKYVFNLRRIRENMLQYVIPQTEVYDVITQMASVSNIPFKGEPVQGLQIMGALESRLLDFKNLIILSFNDEKIPKSQELQSLIPYSLRCAYELPTSDYNDRLYAYNFYRMLYRAENIHFIYDSRTENVSSNNEISRFYYQLKYLYSKRYEIVDCYVKYQTKKIDLHSTSLEFQKTNPNIKAELNKYSSLGYNSKRLSPSAIDNYINCPLKFLFSNVLGIRQDKELNEETDSAELGTVFHSCMENIYGNSKKPTMYNHIGRVITKELIESFSERAIDALIDDSFVKVCKVKNIKGINLLNKIVVKQLVESTLQYDKNRAPFRYVDSEFLIDNCSVPVSVNGEQRNINFKGYIDRVDEKDGELFIVDYKTGKTSDHLSVENVDTFFDATNKKRPKEVFQTLVYCYLIRLHAAKFPTLKADRVSPLIYAVKDLNRTDISFLEKEENQTVSNYINSVMPQFETKLKDLVADIFDETKPFTATPEESRCSYCQFSNICKTNL